MLCSPYLVVTRALGVTLQQPVLGVRGEEGVKQEASLSSIWRMLWMTSPAPEHLSAKSFLDRKHRALPGNKQELLFTLNKSFKKVEICEIEQDRFKSVFVQGL